MNNWDNNNTKSLAKAILTLDSPQEVKNFLRDLLTEEELLEIGKRWQAARMLHNKIPYQTIQKETGLSSTTVARISKWLQTGTGGYLDAIKKMEK